MKFFTTFIALLLVITIASAKSTPSRRNRDYDEFTPVIDQVSISTHNVYTWHEGSHPFHQYEVTIYNNSPYTLLSVHIDIKNPNGLKLRNDGSLWNADWVKASPYNQFVLPSGETIYEHNVYKFTFIVDGDATPILELGTIRY